MMKKAIFSLVVLIALLGVLVVSADARLKTDTRVEQANQAKKTPVHDGMTGAELRPHVGPVGLPLGVAANPNLIDSRGKLIGQTWRDWQENSTIGRLVASNPPVVGFPGIHFVWMNSSLSTDYGVAPASKMQMAYSIYDPATGTFPLPGGVTIQDGGPGSTERGDYPKVVAHPVTGAAIVAGFDWENRTAGVNDWRYHVYFDLIPGTGAFGTIADGSSMTSAAMDSGGVRSRWPRCSW